MSQPRGAQRRRSGSRQRSGSRNRSQSRGPPQGRRQQRPRVVYVQARSAGNSRNRQRGPVSASDRVEFQLHNLLRDQLSISSSSPGDARHGPLGKAKPMAALCLNIAKSLVHGHGVIIAKPGTNEVTVTVTVKSPVVLSTQSGSSNPAALEKGCTTAAVSM
ncbi:hypothetical protein [Guangdong greater green snake arterivirus]|uniref:Uncharacterized protein n=1 Tax=Guangdong greater green snake arterivirus TaxID=2116442 RepID=A0A2P1GMV2_9NIDO|nr:hypothetical protein [Guangdong greater green snake arterivirus]AVM87325.1 hypothetical protein [Guangdong greater green snake arterivirus]